MGWAYGGHLLFFQSLVFVGAVQRGWGTAAMRKEILPTVCGGRVVDSSGRPPGRDTKRHSAQEEEKKYFF